jgi:signal transduction histidine kinase
VTDAGGVEGRAAALTGIVARMAEADSREAMAQALAGGVVQTTGMIACGVLLLDGDPPRLRVAGAHGLPADYAQRFEAVVAAGWTLPAVRACATGCPVVVARHGYDPMLAGLRELDGDLAWDRIVCVPLVAGGRAVGALEGFFGPVPAADADLAGVLGAFGNQPAVEHAQVPSDGQKRLVLQERRRLARELHDSVSQALFSMTLQARAAQLALEQDGIDPGGPLGRRIARLRELTEGALAEVRALIFELRPEALQEEGLVAAIRKQAEGLAAREDLVLEVDAPQERISLPAKVEEQLYRVAQEALGNVVRHAAASRIRIRLQVTDLPEATVILEIVDDGVGFDPSRPRPGHLGLASMAARTSQLGGRLEVDSAPGHGTRVRAVVPVPTGPRPVAGAARPPRRRCG